MFHFHSVLGLCFLSQYITHRRVSFFFLAEHYCSLFFEEILCYIYIWCLELPREAYVRAFLFRIHPFPTFFRFFFRGASRAQPSSRWVRVVLQHVIFVNTKKRYLSI